jgi:hypothetical protein
MNEVARSLLSVLVATGGLALAGHAARADEPAPAVRRFALIASSNDGGADRLRLRFADSDAHTMAEVLRNLGGLRAEDMVLLNGATRESLQSSFGHVRAALANAGQQGLRRELFIYYSGHSDEEGLLLGGEHLSYDELRRWLKSTNADVRIAVLDSCASGALLRSRGGARRPPFLLTDLRATSASLVLAQDVEGRAYVRDATGRLLVEVYKEPAHPMALGLPPGDYSVALERGGRHFDAQTSLNDGAKTYLAMPQFTTTAPVLAQARGSAPSSPASSAERASFIDTAIGEDSLIGRTRQLGGYAGLGFRYSELGDTDGFMAALEAALLINRRFAVGVAAGGGFSAPVDAERNRIFGGYAGVVARYHFLFDSPASVSLGALAGAGGFELEEETDDAADDEPSDAVFLFEPQITGDLDVTRFMRIGVDFGYRLVAGAEVIDPSYLRGFTGGFHVQLGWF